MAPSFEGAIFVLMLIRQTKKPGHLPGSFIQYIKGSKLILA